MGTPDLAFERDIQPVRTNRSKTPLTYSRDSVLRYRVNDIQEIVDNPSILLKMIQHHHEYQVPRLVILEDYYLGNNTTIVTGSRRIENDKSDHRIRHGWASIISDFINSYVLSNPIKIDGATDEFSEVIEEFNQGNDIDAHNVELGKDQNNFGRAYELLQRTEDDSDRIYQLDPRTVFMIYDRTVRTRVIGACRYYQVDEFDSEGESKKYEIELYTFNKIYSYEPTDIYTGKLTESNVIDHLFGGVPIIEYRSDRFKMGVYEKQIPLIDAYDAAQSDTANYMTDFNDAILAIYGRVANAEDSEYVKTMRDMNILFLIPEDSGFEGKSSVSAGYLTKSYDVAGVEAYKDRIKEDIFTTGSAPNLSDSSFSGNKSGEALKYKMFGLQQKKSDKEKYFSKGLRVRYRLLENLKRTVKELSGDENNLTFGFTENLPKAYLEELQAFISSGGVLSQKTMLSLPSFVEDVETELDNIEQEQNERYGMIDFVGGQGDDHDQS